MVEESRRSAARSAWFDFALDGFCGAHLLDPLSDEMGVVLKLLRQLQRGQLIRRMVRWGVAGVAVGTPHGTPRGASAPVGPWSRGSDSANLLALGRLAQLGEHQLDKLGVTGSSPVPPITETPAQRGFRSQEGNGSELVHGSGLCSASAVARGRLATRPPREGCRFTRRDDCGSTVFYEGIRGWRCPRRWNTTTESHHHKAGLTLAFVL